MVQKNAPTLADYNYDPVQSILIIFGQGIVATYVRWGGKFYHQTTFMIVNKQLAKNYKNRLNWVVVIVRQIWRVFFWTTVYMYVCIYMCWLANTVCLRFCSNVNWASGGASGLSRISRQQQQQPKVFLGWRMGYWPSSRPKSWRDWFMVMWAWWFWLVLLCNTW